MKQKDIIETDVSLPCNLLVKNRLGIGLNMSWKYDTKKKLLTLTLRKPEDVKEDE